MCKKLLLISIIFVVGQSLCLGQEVREQPLKALTKEQRNELVVRLRELVSHEKQRDWKRVYSLLSPRLHTYLSEEDFIAQRVSTQAADQDLLIDFAPASEQFFDKSIFGFEVWLVISVANFKRLGEWLRSAQPWRPFKKEGPGFFPTSSHRSALTPRRSPAV